LRCRRGKRRPESYGAPTISFLRCSAALRTWATPVREGLTAPEVGKKPAAIT
jgi:hypothetical protein